jgi:hypothetical protein
MGNPENNNGADRDGECSPGRLIWDADVPAPQNFEVFAPAMVAGRDLFRLSGHEGGLALVRKDGTSKRVTTTQELLSLLADRFDYLVLKNGKPQGGRIPPADLAVMLTSEKFLRHFPSLDRVTRAPLYLPGFILTQPGYNDAGPGHRVYYHAGEPAAIAEGLVYTRRFLDVMHFATNADRTNAVAAALTVQLRHLFVGGSPVLAVTGNRSHCGKDTVIAFAAGSTEMVSISYEAQDWALESNAVRVLKKHPDAGVLVVDNARLGKGQRAIASAFLERTATSARLQLTAPTSRGEVVTRPNDLVIAISTNYGSLSQDLLNRALPVHLEFHGDLAERASPIGNPKLEYLPRHREEMAAEVRGMVERWKRAGMPLDERAAHSFGPWARTVGGILRANGFADFLGATSAAARDPEWEALAHLGAARPGEWLRPAQWAQVADEQGLTRALFPAPEDRDGERAKERSFGLLLTRHLRETFTATTDEVVLRLRLEKSRKRSDGHHPKRCYRFAEIERRAVPDDPE